MQPLLVPFILLLSGMLVLTTMFVSVAGSLPQTSNVKMIEVWLLSCLMVPFTEVLLQVRSMTFINTHFPALVIKVYMDTLRGDEDREINHHGTVRKVGDEVDGVDEVRTFSHSELRHRDEKKELEARKKFYEHMKQKKRNEEKLKFCKKIGKHIIPTICLTFTSVYWLYGLSQI